MHNDADNQQNEERPEEGALEEFADEQCSSQRQQRVHQRNVQHGNAKRMYAFPGLAEDVLEPTIHSILLLYNYEILFEPETCRLVQLPE